MKVTISQLHELIEHDTLVSVNIKRHTFSIEGKAAQFTMEENFPSQDFISRMERLYREYKYSMPSESSQKRRMLFKALPLEKLPEDAFLYGERRDKAAKKLESYILYGVLSGILTWKLLDPSGKHYFWQSEQDRDFIILREWFNSEIKQ